MNYILLKYLCLKDDELPSQIHKIPSRESVFFTSKIYEKFGKRKLYNHDGKSYIFTSLFTRVDEFDQQTLRRLIRDVRCYFNRLCIENPNKLYGEVSPIDWSKFDYRF